MSMDEMRLYIMNCGNMITPEGNVLAALNTGQLKLVIPVPVYLLAHPKQGLVLIDTGFRYEHIPDEMKMNIAWSPLLRIRTQISRLGYDPDDVKHVLLSHLHFDHAGQMMDFPKAVFHMRKSEWEDALPPSRPDYFECAYKEAHTLRFEYIPEEKDQDIFGDGSVISMATPGHSKGHSSFIVSMPNSGKFLLAMDAAHLPQYMEDTKFFADSKDPAGCIRSVEKLKKLQKECVRTIYGHDPAGFSGLKTAPDYYD